MMLPPALAEGLNKAMAEARAEGFAQGYEQGRTDERAGWRAALRSLLGDGPDVEQDTRAGVGATAPRPPSEGRSELEVAPMAAPDGKAADGPLPVAEVETPAQPGGVTPPPEPPVAAVRQKAARPRAHAADGGRGYRTKPRPPSWRTPERAALLDEAWPDGVPTDEIVRQMEADGGLPVPSANHVSIWAAERGKRRSKEFRLKQAQDAGRLGGRKLGPENQARGVEAARARVEAAARLRPSPAERLPPAGDNSGARDVPGIAAPPAGDNSGALGAPAVAPPHAASPGAAPKRVMPRLPEPAENGRVYASFSEIREWAAFMGIAYDGSNMDMVNRRRAAMGAPPVVQDGT